jgi:hypothetical protein
MRGGWTYMLCRFGPFSILMAPITLHVLNNAVAFLFVR